MTNEKIFTPNDLKQLQILIQPSFLKQFLKQENDKIFISKIWLKDLETIIFDEEGFLFSQISSDFICYVGEKQKQNILKELTFVIMDLYDFFSSTYLKVEDYKKLSGYFLYCLNFFNPYFDLNDLYKENSNRFIEIFTNEEIKILFNEKLNLLYDFLNDLPTKMKKDFINDLIFSEDKRKDIKSILDNNPDIKDKLKMYGIDLEQEIQQKENTENGIHKSTSLDVTDDLKYNKIISFFKKCFKFNDQLK